MSQEQRPLKEYEPHGSPINDDEDRPLDEVFREAAREGTLAE